MKKLLLILSLVSQTAFAHYTTVVKKNSQLPITTFNITFETGSVNDPADSKGLAALTANLMREGGLKAALGQPAQTRAELEETLFPLAAEIQVSVEKEQISFQVTATAQEAERVFGLMAQMILAPQFDEQEFLRLKSEALDALSKQYPTQDQEELGKAALIRAVYGDGHPYAHVVTGTLAGVGNISLAQIKDFYKNHFTQGQLVVGVAGTVTPSLSKKIAEIFNSLPEGTEQKSKIAVATLPGRSKLLLVKGPFEAVGVHLGEPLSVTRASAEFPKLYLASIGFGKHRSFVGRLMKVVREIRGLNYGTYFYVEEFPQGGHRMTEPTQAARTRQIFSLWARPTTLENGCFLLRQVHREVQSLNENGLTPEEFDLTKSHLIGNVPLLGMSLERQLGYAVDSHFYGIQGDYLGKLQSEIKKTTRSQVNAILGKLLHPRQMQIVVVTPDPDRFKKEILSPQCQIHYAKGIDKSAEILQEDQQISVHSVGLKEEDVNIVDTKSLFMK